MRPIFVFYDLTPKNVRFRIKCTFESRTHKISLGIILCKSIRWNTIVHIHNLPIEVWYIAHISKLAQVTLISQHMAYACNLSLVHVFFVIFSLNKYWSCLVSSTLFGIHPTAFTNVILWSILLLNTIITDSCPRNAWI